MRVISIVWLRTWFAKSHSRPPSPLRARALEPKAGVPGEGVDAAKLDGARAFVRSITAVGVAVGIDTGKVCHDRLVFRLIDPRIRLRAVHDRKRRRVRHRAAIVDN